MGEKNYNYNMSCTPFRYDFRAKETNIRYYLNQFMNRLQMMFEIDGLPETISKRDMLLLIFTRGYGVMIENEGNHYIVEASLGGTPTANYMPTIATVANPALKNLKNYYTIDEDCVVFNCDSSYMGFMPILTKYATALVENDLSMNIVDIVSRAMSILAAKTQNTKNAVDSILKDLEEGKLASVKSSILDDDMISSLPFAGTSAMSNLIISLIEYEQYLKGSCWMDIGVKAPFNMKREALGDAENDLQDASLLPYVDNVKYCLDEACKKANKMFDLNLKVSFTSAWEDIQNEEEHQEDEDEIAPPVDESEVNEDEL